MTNQNNSAENFQTASRNKKRRAWSTEEKLNMLQEAEQPNSNFSRIAKKYDISASQLFAWRKLKMKGHFQEEKVSINYLDLEKEIISANHKAANLEDGLFKLADEIKKGKLSLYQGICAYSALVGAACKIAHLKFEIWDRVVPYIRQDNIAMQNNPLEDEMRRESANILVKILEMRKNQQNQNNSEQG
ncbi:MAG: transposase [Cyanobacteria bacterium TGS_CYA1]|nr:transposase [Cyanobacteria bacterium TGS_CYA1]